MWKLSTSHSAAAVVHDPRDKRAAPARFVRDYLRRRKALGVLFEPLQAEEFSANRLFRFGKDNGRWLILIHLEGRNCGTTLLRDRDLSPKTKGPSLLIRGWLSLA